MRLFNYKAILGAVFILSGLFVQAQDVCTIKGVIKNDSLRFSQKKLEKIYLFSQDEYNRFNKVDSTMLKDTKFTFTRQLKKNEPILLYFIGGFDNGAVPVCVEKGTVNVVVEKAAYPKGAKVWGTVNNDIYLEYNKFATQCAIEQTEKMKPFIENNGEEWIDSEEGWKVRKEIGASALITCNEKRLKFLLEHNDSPLAPLLMEREMAYMLTPLYAEKLFNSISPKLKNHPYYRSFSNYVKALELKVGSEIPDITIPLLNGKMAHLSDFRGKYVLLDFWASWCAPCRKELPHLQQLYRETRNKQDKFVIVSFSIDNKEQDWKRAINKFNINKKGWIHGSDLLGWSSPSAVMLGVSAVPKMILIDPEGKAISFTLRGEQLVKRVRQILSGDMYYKK